MLGTLVTAFSLKTMTRTSACIIPLLWDNQGNVFSLLDSKSRKMPSAAVLLMLLLHRKSCTLAPFHVKQDVNQWADELTHPDYQGFSPDHRLRVSRLLRGLHFLLL